jgi:hypothetical protein
MAVDKHTLSLTAKPFIASDDHAFIIGGDDAIRANPVFLVNDFASPAAVVGIAQARLERVYSMIHMLSTMDSSESAFTITDMASAIEPQLDEVKQLLQVAQARLRGPAVAEPAPERDAA